MIILLSVLFFNYKIVNNFVNVKILQKKIRFYKFFMLIYNIYKNFENYKNANYFN